MIRIHGLLLALSFLSLEGGITKVTKTNYAQFVKNASKPLVIYMYIPGDGWSGIMRPTFEKYAEKHNNNYVFGMLNFEEESCKAILDLNIQYYPATVVYVGGKAIGILMGKKSYEELTKEIAELFETAKKRDLVNKYMKELK